MFKGAKKFCYCAVTEYMTKLINDYHFIRVSHLQNFFNSFAKHLARQFLKRLEGKKKISIQKAEKTTQNKSKYVNN